MKFGLLSKNAGKFQPRIVLKQKYFIQSFEPFKAKSNNCYVSSTRNPFRETKVYYIQVQNTIYQSSLLSKQSFSVSNKEISIGDKFSGSAEGFFPILFGCNRGSCDEIFGDWCIRTCPALQFQQCSITYFCRTFTLFLQNSKVLTWNIFNCTNCFHFESFFPLKLTICHWFTKQEDIAHQDAMIFFIQFVLLSGRCSNVQQAFFHNCSPGTHQTNWLKTKMLFLVQKQ